MCVTQHAHARTQTGYAARRSVRHACTCARGSTQWVTTWPGKARRGSGIASRTGKQQQVMTAHGPSSCMGASMQAMSQRGGVHGVG